LAIPELVQAVFSGLVKVGVGDIASPALAGIVQDPRQAAAKYSWAVHSAMSRMKRDPIFRN
jgi:hypothetical protein